MKIIQITAIPLSYRLPEGKTVTLGIGSTTKRDTIMVRVETSEGITGYGEAHPGRSPGVIVSLTHSTLRPLLVGMDATDCNGAWLATSLPSCESPTWSPSSETKVVNEAGVKLD